MKLVDVALVKGEKIADQVPMYDSVKVVKQALDLLGGMESFVKKDDYIILKPNYGVPIPQKHYAVPLSTSPGVLEGIILEAQKAGARKVGIAEGLPRTGMVRSKGMMKKNAPTYDMVYTACGGKMLKEKYPDFVDLRFLEIEPRTKTEITGGIVLKEFDMWKAFLDCDLFVNVPIMKTHFITGCATLAIKNLHGIVGDYMHLAHRAAGRQVVVCRFLDYLRWRYVSLRVDLVRDQHDPVRQSLLLLDHRDLRHQRHLVHIRLLLIRGTVLYARLRHPPSRSGPRSLPRWVLWFPASASGRT